MGYTEQRLCTSRGCRGAFVMQCCTCKVAHRFWRWAPLERDGGRVMTDRNVERLAETRARLLDAVIESLAERGYHATSTTEVARRSGLTRGAQLHHFGTKERMMVAAVDRLNERSHAEEIARALDDVPADDRIRVALEVLSSLVSGTEPQAYAELWVASRDQPELASTLQANDDVGTRRGACVVRSGDPRARRPSVRRTARSRHVRAARHGTRCASGLTRRPTDPQGDDRRHGATAGRGIAMTTASTWVRRRRARAVADCTGA